MLVWLIFVTSMSTVLNGSYAIQKLEMRSMEACQRAATEIRSKAGGSIGTSCINAETGEVWLAK